MTTFESIGLSEGAKTPETADSKQEPDRVKLINDHNLRVLIEQNVELRHCDTLSVTSLAVSAALTGLITTVAYNIILKSDSNTASFAWVFFDCILPPFLCIAVFLTLAGIRIMATEANAEKNIATFYKEFTRFNGISLETLIFIQQKKTYDKKKIEGDQRYGRTSLAIFVPITGVCSLTLLFIFWFVEIFTGHRN